QRDEMNAWPDENPQVIVDARHPAYVIYTSGSTGQPKGVIVTREGLSNYLQWAIAEYRVGARGALAHSSIAFDLTVTTVFLPLLRGGRIAMSGGDDLEMLSQLASRLDEFDLLKITPSHLDFISPPSERLPSGWDGVVVVGGEALTYERLQAWRAGSPSARIVNEYGPTETVVGCVTYEVGSQDPASGRVPIGKPIWNTQVLVLDAMLQPSPAGVLGELYIAGAGLGRGYLNRPHATAERFVANPYGPSGTRLYRTGDRVRRLANGILEYIGRADEQIKISGYRIEPEDIERALTRHAAVRDAAVMALHDDASAARLAAYLIAGADGAVAPAALTAHLAGLLPSHMIPSSFVWIQEFPRTKNGKLDRAALRRLEPARIERARS